MTLMATDTLGEQAEVCWRTFPPGEHLVQMYADDATLVESLAGFICAGLTKGEGVIVLATPAHLCAAAERCAAQGIDLPAAALADQYVAMDAAAVLSRFMTDRKPDEYLFDTVLAALLKRAGRGGRPVRAFGEMVALLWSQGQFDATVQLEVLWHRACQMHNFSLFCAYPKSQFGNDAGPYVNRICACHSKVVGG